MALGNPSPEQASRGVKRALQTTEPGVALPREGPEQGVEARFADPGATGIPAGLGAGGDCQEESTRAEGQDPVLGAPGGRGFLRGREAEGFQANFLGR